MIEDPSLTIALIVAVLGAALFLGGPDDRSPA